MAGPCTLAARERPGPPVFAGSRRHRSLWILALPVGVRVLSVFALSQWKGMFRTFSHAYGPFT